MKTRSNMPLFVLECDNVKTLSNSQIDLLRCGDYLVKKDASGEHAYKVTFKSSTGMCLTYHDAYCVETQSYDLIDGVWTYNSEDKTIIAEPQMENIVDANGHKRFIEGDVNIIGSISGLSKTYGKWSLSGTHLMIVVAGDIDAGTTLAGTTPLFVCADLPTWVYDKIAVLKGVGVDWKTFNVIAPDWTPTATSIVLAKDNGLKIQQDASETYTDGGIFRYNFDLLIDNE